MNLCYDHLPESPGRCRVLRIALPICDKELPHKVAVESIRAHQVPRTAFARFATDPMSDVSCLGFESFHLMCGLELWSFINEFSNL